MTMQTRRIRSISTVSCVLVALGMLVPRAAHAAPPTDADAGSSDSAAAPPAETPPADDDDDWGDDDEPAGDLVFVDETGKGDEVEKVEQVDVKGAKGTVAGVVTDNVSGDPIGGALVTALDTEFQVSTDAEGRFELVLPPGTYKIQFYYDAYKLKVITNVEVREDKARTENISLVPNEDFVSETVIEAEAPKGLSNVVLDERKNKAAASDSMSAEEANKGGGGSVAGVSRRIVGSTIVGGRFLYVRGLGNRYGNTLFDGARLPSPEPEQRTIPLDIFPSGALSSIDVVKTLEADTPADFAGASTQLRSRDIPDRFTWGVGVGMGVNTVTTGQTFRPDHNFGPGDGLGFGNLTRGLPDSLPKDQRAGFAESDPTTGLPLWSPDQLEGFGESLRNQTPFNSTSALPNFNAKANVGSGHDLGNGHRLGWYIGTSYKNNREFRGQEIQRYLACGNACGAGADPDAKLVPQVDLVTSRSTQQVAWSTIGMLRWKIQDHSNLRFTTFYSRDAENEVRLQRGRSLGVTTSADILSSRHRYIMRSVLFTQLGGSHEIKAAKGLTIDWFGSYAQARRDDPAIREMVWSLEDPQNPSLDLTNGGGKQLYLNLVDHTESGGLDLTQPFKQWGGLKAKVKFGGWLEGKQRTFLARRFAYRSASGLAGSIPNEFGSVINPSTIGGGLSAAQGGTEPFVLDETTRLNDNYLAQQTIGAAHASMELPMVRWLKLVGGLRFERSDMNVRPFNPVNAPDDGTPILRSRLLRNDLFPTASIIFSWKARKQAPEADMNVRLSGYRTTARPEFRELVQFQFVDFIGGATVTGNPFLVPTYIWNADLRWEWFPSGDEVIAVSGFYKRFQDPIERIIDSSIPANASFKNAKQADLAGGELEMRKNLAFLAGRKSIDAAPNSRAGRARDVLSDFSIGANLALVWSRVVIEPQRDAMGNEITSPAQCDPTDAQCQFEAAFNSLTRRRREMQGQSPYVVNAFLGYENDDVGFGGRLLYNVYGPRIDQVGAQGLPDIYELAFNSVDVVVSQRLLRTVDNKDSFDANSRNELMLNFGAYNILNQQRRFVQREPQLGSNTIVQSWYPGVTLELGLEYKF